jgi:hypothetical protein
MFQNFSDWLLPIMLLSFSKLSFQFINRARFQLKQAFMSSSHLNIFQLQQLRKQQQLRYKNVVQNDELEQPFQYKPLIARILSFTKNTSIFQQVCKEWMMMCSGIQVYETWFLEQRTNMKR